MKETPQTKGLQSIRNDLGDVPGVKNFNDVRRGIKESRETIRQASGTIKKEATKQILDGVNSEGTRIRNEFETSSGIPLTEIQNRFSKVGKMMQDSKARFEKRNRVTKTTIVLMVALSYDTAQFFLNWLPFLGTILASLVGIYAWLTFYVWTSIKGWGMSDSINKFIVSKVLPFIGCIGVLNVGPEITAGVVFTILIVKSEDFIYNKTKGRLDEAVIIEGSKTLKYLKKLV